MNKPLLTLAALALPLAAIDAAIITDTFSANFNNFTVQQSGSADSFGWVNTAGVGGVAGRIDTIKDSADHGDAVYYSGTGAAVTWNTGVTYAASIFFLQGTITDGNIYQARSGFLRSTGSNFGGGGSAVWAQLRDSGGGDPFLQLYTQATQVGSNSASFAMSANTWYELETRMTLSNATTGDLGVFLYSRGSDGTAARTLVQSITTTGTTILNGGFSGTQFWSTFGGGNNSGNNVVAFDNFTVVPEPSTYALLAGVATLGLVLYRRRARG